MSTKKLTKNTFGEQLLFLINHFSKGNLKAFATSLDMIPNTLRNYVEGREAKIGIITRIYEVYGVSPTWLLLGQGEMFLDKNKKETNVGEIIDQWAKSLIEAGTHTEEGLLYDLRTADKRIDMFVAKREKLGLQSDTISRQKIA